MITRLAITNWQSLREVDLPLGRFTVIVGPSSSGKTAFMRALRGLVGNVRGAANITRGASHCAVAAYLDGHTVTLERSVHGGQYRLTSPEGERVYTKLAGGVPQDITRLLRINPDGDLHFAGQFDRPYLLDESGAAVARVLGELTNVSLLFSAVREANRRRDAHAKTLKIREADLAALIEQSRTYAHLGTRLAACQAAEDTAESAARLQDRLTRLQRHTEALSVADGVLARTATLPAVPTDAPVATARDRLRAFERAVNDLTAANNAIATATQALVDATASETTLHTELHDALVAAGTCPTCGQPVTA